MRKPLFLFFVCSFSVFVFSQIPTGYYDSAVGKKKAALKTALHLKIKTATVLSYGGGDGKTWSGFAITDVRPSDGLVWDMYSNLNYSFNGNLAVTGMNIEHSFAKSWWGGTETQAYKDLHHLNPSDATANQRKSSYMMATVDTILTYTNDVIKVGKTRRKAGLLVPAWEPADEYKGDFARVYMYMVTAYQDYAPLWQGDSEHQLDNNTYPVFEPWAVDLLLQWSRQDPVSIKEINRNNAVYSIQGNRNPYIDFPEMGEYVWGNKTTVPFTLNGVVDFPYLAFPDNNDTIDMDSVYMDHSIDYQLPIKAANLTGNLTLALSGADAANFTLSATNIAQTTAHSGTHINIHFNAVTVGANHADLIISGGGIQPIIVHLNAYTSTDFVALPATGILPSGFNANWTTSIDAGSYLLNVFSLRPTGVILRDTVLEQDFTLALPNTWAKEGWTDNTLAGNIKLASGSNYGKVSLPVMDLSATGFRLTVVAKQYNTDNGAKLTATLNNQTVATWTTSTAYQTFTVDVPSATAASVFSLSAIAGKRIYIDYLNLQSLTPEMYRVPINGYPLNVGNVLTYRVNDLLVDSTYYYSVTPQGNAEVESNSIKVRTDLSTNIKSVKKKIAYKRVPDGIVVENSDEDSVLNVFDICGNKIISRPVASSSVTLPLSKKGIYLIQAVYNQENIVAKIIF